MAKPTPGTAPLAESLDAKLITWGAGEIMYRVHDAVYAADSFNPSPLGNARFSPIRDPSGSVIPTLYAATTPQGALMETVFHDVPYKPGFKRVSIARLAGKLSSTVVFLLDFQLIDLGKVGLRRLGVHPHDLIDTTKAHYPETRKWAESLYAAYPQGQGLIWPSRQDDRARAVVLFGTRVRASELRPAGLSIPLMGNGVVHEVAKALATDLKVLIE
jgi:RES domain